MGRRPRTAAPPSPTATSWSGRFAGSRSTSGRSSSCTTTSGCRSWRSPSCWRSPRARPDRACTTPRAGSATPSTAEAELDTPRRTSRMTDDRSLERAARSWLETGPTQAPDRAVEAALLRIETTPQERDLRIPWRFTDMTTACPRRRGRRHRRACWSAAPCTCSRREADRVSARPGHRPSAVSTPGTTPSPAGVARHLRPMPCRSDDLGVRLAGAGRSFRRRALWRESRTSPLDHRLERMVGMHRIETLHGRERVQVRGACVRRCDRARDTVAEATDQWRRRRVAPEGQVGHYRWSRAPDADVPHPDRDRRPVRRPQHDVVPDTARLALDAS